MLLSCPLSLMLGVILLNESHTFAFMDGIQNCKSKMNVTQLSFVSGFWADFIE